MQRKCEGGSCNGRENNHCDNRREKIGKRGRYTCFENEDSMLVGPHVSHLTNTIETIVGFYCKDGDNRSYRQTCVSELFLLVEFSYKEGPKAVPNSQEQKKLHFCFCFYKN